MRQPLRRLKKKMHSRIIIIRNFGEIHTSTHELGVDDLFDDSFLCRKPQNQLRLQPWMIVA
jgi:hypothetical protein